MKWKFNFFSCRNWLKTNYKNSKDHKKTRKSQAQLNKLKLHQVCRKDRLLLHQHFHARTQESWKVMREPNLSQASWIPLSVLKRQMPRRLNLAIKYRKRWLLSLTNNMIQPIWLLNACLQFQNPIMAPSFKTTLKTQERINSWLQTMLTSKAPTQGTWENQMDAFSTIERIF